MTNFRIPVTVVDNFWEDPDSLVSFSKQVSYDEKGNFPGIRARLDHTNLFQPVINKVISYFAFVNESTTWQASLAFQITNSELRKGWVHLDNDALFAFILYLDENPDPDSGTSIFSRNTYNHDIETQEVKQLKRNAQNDSLLLDENYFDTMDRFNSQFTETMEVKNVFNRILIFDSSTYHGVKKFVDNRLTMVGFINRLSARKYYP